MFKTCSSGQCGCMQVAIIVVPQISLVLDMSNNIVFIRLVLSPTV